MAQRKDFKREGSFTNINVAALEKDADTSGIIWTTERVNKLLKDYEAGIIDIRGYKGSPFLSNDVNLRKPGLQFQYTKEEMRELRRCARDPVYFAATYCKLFTESGYIKVNLRDYQREVVNGFMDNRFVILMAARQVGKCHFFCSKVTIYNKNTNEVSNIPLYELWYGLLKKNKSNTIYSWIKYRLYRIYDNLLNNKCA